MALVLGRGAEPAYAGESDPQHAVDIALAAWKKGAFAKVRAALAEFDEVSVPKADAATLEVALRYLADAALLDTSIDASLRASIARRAIRRLLDLRPQWVPPRGLHADPFYRMVKEVRSQRLVERAASCVAERQACSAELTQSHHDHARLTSEHQQLQRAYNEQIVVVEQRVARSRWAALMPFGLGHFYNDRPKLGWTFLATETALGASALSMLLYRVYGLNCTRTRGFAPGSLRCDVDPSKAHLARSVRNAEQALSIALLSTLIADLVVAQVVFRPYRSAGTRKIRRKKLRPQRIARPRAWFRGPSAGLGLSGSF